MENNIIIQNLKRIYHYCFQNNTYSDYIKKSIYDFLKYINKYEHKKQITNITRNTSRIIAIGDIHGDMDLMLDLLKIANVIEETSKTFSDCNIIELNYKGNIDDKKYFKWIGNDTVIVQVGDQVDRCRPLNDFKTCENPEITFEDEASDIEILLFFTKLNDIAEKFGGAVYSLLGNHELMNCYGDVRYVSYLNLEQVKNKNGRIDIFKRGGYLSRFLAYTRLSVIIINGYLFVHGGILGDKKKSNNYFESINEVIKKWLIINDDEQLKIDLQKNIKNKILKNYFYDGHINKFIFDTNSPFITRKLGNIKPNVSIDNIECSDIKQLIHKFNLKGIIIGHTPQLNNINSINGTCDNKLFRVDIASSKAFFYVTRELLKPQVLEISIDGTTKILN